MNLAAHKAAENYLHFDPVQVAQRAIRNGSIRLPEPQMSLSNSERVKRSRNKRVAMGLTVLGKRRVNKSWPELAHLKGGSQEYHIGYMRLRRRLSTLAAKQK